MAGLSDRFLDAMVAWGDVDAVASRVREQLDAGADHVALSMLSSTSDGPGWPELAAALVNPRE